MYKRLSMVKSIYMAGYLQIAKILHFLVVVICLSLLYSFGYASDNVTVAYVGFSTDKPFWIALGRSIRNESEKKGLTLIDLTPTEPDALLQGKLIEHAIDKGVDALIVGADTPSLLNDSLSKAQHADIPVVTVDTRISHPAVLAFVETDNVKGAQLAGEYIVEKTGGKGSVLVLGGSEGHPNGDARKNGVIFAAERAGMEVIFRYANWHYEQAYRISNQELRKNSTISAVFSCWDPGIDTVSHVVDKLGLDKQLVLVGFDGLPRTLNYIRQGRVTATVAQDTALMGKRSVELVLEIINKDSFQAQNLISPYIVDKDTVDKKVMEVNQLLK